MKTYTKTVVRELPMLIIRNDENSESPRVSCSNLGYFFTNERNHRSPDGNTNEIYQIMVETAEDASDTDDHIAKMKERISDEVGEKVLAIYPVNRFEHGNVVYRLGKSKGFDVSNCGFYIVTNDMAKARNVKKDDFEEAIKEELEQYTKWCNGEVYEYELFNEQGDSVDSCTGFYSIEDMKDMLPSEWKDEDLSEYVIND